MKVVAIHQPHYFPWLGYLDKMAKADEFIIMDDVQFTDGSPMARNKFLQLDGQAKLLSLSIEKKGYFEKPTKEIRLHDWGRIAKKHRSFFECNYKKTPYYDEIMSFVRSVFEKQYDTLLEVDLATMGILRDMYDITVPLVMQSSLNYCQISKNNELVLDLCMSAGADVYLSGRGARSYMDVEPFEKRGISVFFQEFSQPEYPQYKQGEFVEKLSALDMLFQCGIEGARRRFRNNMKYEVG